MWRSSSLWGDSNSPVAGLRTCSLRTPSLSRKTAAEGQKVILFLTKSVDHHVPNHSLPTFGMGGDCFFIYDGNQNTNIREFFCRSAVATNHRKNRCAFR